MSANNRIIRDERDEDGLFDTPGASAPRIDLILGVSLAVIVSVLGVLGSLGVGAINAGPDLTDAQRPVAAAPAMEEATPRIAQSPVFDGFLHDDAAFGDGPFLFDVVDAPLEAETRRPIVIDRLTTLADDIVVEDCVSDAETPADDAPTDARRVVRMLAAAARVAADDPEVDAAIDELRLTVETLVEQAERAEAARDPETTGPTALRMPTLRMPRFERGL